MRTVAVFAAHASSTAVWVYCRQDAAGEGTDKFTVTEPGGLQALPLTDADVDMGRATFMFTAQVTRSAIEDGG